ncbi:MAG TPA: metallophosphoesterase [Terriglobales bacterium]|nr:metallophosphoesterase [Terriglobales bacterium]
MQNRLRLTLLIYCACACLLLASCTRSHSEQAAPNPAELRLNVHIPFRFVAYGDIRFTNPRNTDASNPVAREAIVKAIAETNPAFICVTGDLVYRGTNVEDWQIWDQSTQIWREQKIPVFPALGNHDLHGDQKVALANYSQRFPELQGSRFYSVRAANALILVLDSSLDETSGPQGQWLTSQLDHLSPDVDFVFLMLHHPPYTHSTDEAMGGGHSARSPEQALAQMLESRQAKMHASIVVFAGHVHNYERYEHGGVTYFVTGGGGAHPYMINREPGDPFQGKGVNYHYLLAEVDHGKLKVTMNKVDVDNGNVTWTQPDSVTITPPVAAMKVGSGS